MCAKGVHVQEVVEGREGRQGGAVCSKGGGKMQKGVKVSSAAGI